MQGEISRNMNTHQVHKYWIKGNCDEYTSINMKTQGKYGKICTFKHSQTNWSVNKIMMIIITYLETVIPRYCKIHLQQFVAGPCVLSEEDYVLIQINSNKLQIQTKLIYIVLNPAHVPSYGMSTPTKYCIPKIGFDKPTSRCQSLHLM